MSDHGARQRVEGIIRKTGPIWDTDTAVDEIMAIIAKEGQSGRLLLAVAAVNTVADLDGVKVDAWSMAAAAIEAWECAPLADRVYEVALSMGADE